MNQTAHYLNLWIGDMDSKTQEGMVGGRYRILSRARADREIITFRAEDSRSGEEVALLVFLASGAGAERADAFRWAARRCALLEHPTLPRVLDMGQDRGVDYVAAEWPGPIALSGLVAKSGGLSIPRLIDIGVQLCACLSSLRQAGISPSGLSTADMALDGRGNAKVAPAALVIRAQGSVAGSPRSDAAQASAIIRGMAGAATPLAPELLQTLEKDHANPMALASALAAYGQSRGRSLPDRSVFRGISLQEPTRLPAAAVPARPTRQGWDKPGIALVVLAIVAVLGVIPLWASVYAKYARPVALAPSYATPIPNTAVVPDLTGLDEATGRSMLEQAGLNLEVIGQEFSDVIPLGKVMTQEPRGGQRTRAGDTIYAVLSKGAANLTVPDVVGQSYSAAAALLAQSSLNASRQDIWSESADDTVVAQDPPGGSEATPGTSVALKVSSGQIMTLNATLGDVTRLLTAQADKGSLRPGETLRLTLRWQSLRPVESRFSVFVHLVSPSGEIVAQDDAEPSRGNRPTSGWKEGEVITDPHTLTLPSNAPAGEYQIRVGLYLPGPNERLPVIDAGRADVQDNALTIHRIAAIP